MGHGCAKVCAETRCVRDETRCAEVIAETPEKEGEILRQGFRRQNAFTASRLPSLLGGDVRGSASISSKPALSALEQDELSTNPDSPRLYMKGEGFSTEANARTEDTTNVPVFVNVMLDHLWPSISEYATKVLGDVIEPAIKTALGSLGGKFGFDLKECHLGSRPAQFTEISTNRAAQLTDAGKLDNVVMKGRLKWEGNISILTRFGTFPIGIRGVKVDGVLVVECVGTMSRPPMFQGVRIFFVNPPCVDLEFQGTLTSVLEFRTVKRQILEVFSSKLSQLLVVPNRMGFLLDQTADFFRVLRPRPKGVLKLSVVRAVQLLAMDSNWYSPSTTSDPYVIVRCGAESFRSATVFKTLEPQLDFVAIFPIVSVRHQWVSVELWDADFGKKDDFLGGFEVPVAALITVAEREGMTWFELEDEEGNIGGRGKVLVNAEWRPLLVGSDTEGLPPDGDGAGAIFAGLYGVSQLPGEVAGTRFWVNAKCTNLFPERPQGWLTTPRLQRQAAVGLATAEAHAAAARLERKLEILKQHGMSHEDIAQVLEVDAGCVRRKGSGMDLKATERHHIKWNHSFEFLALSAKNAVMTFEVRCLAPTRGAEEQILGTCRFELSKLIDMPGCTSLEVIGLENSEICLKVNLQMRWLGGFDKDMWENEIVSV